MAEESLSTMAKKSLIPLIRTTLYPALVSIIIPMASIFILNGCRNNLTHKRYKEYSLVLLAVLLGTTILFLILWVRLHWRYGRFFQACGVLWDKDFRMHCFSLP